MSLHYLQMDRVPKVSDETPMYCCGQLTTVTRTKTRRTHRCKKCGGWWYLDVARREMFGMTIYVSEVTPTHPGLKRLSLDSQNTPHNGPTRTSRSDI